MGVNTGPVTAGIVGALIQTFDLYGDCVNVASRMEATAPNKQVQMSEATHRRTRGMYGVETSGVEGLSLFPPYFLFAFPEELASTSQRDWAHVNIHCISAHLNPMFNASLLCST